METARIQTVLRLPQELMERLRRNARKENISFNSYVERIHIFDIKDAILSCGKDLEDEAIFAHACEKGCDAIITSDRHFREQKAGKGPLMFTPDAFAARLCGKDYSP